jgi:predicted  nucleic acid-binding Zn-ribbon protein
LTAELNELNATEEELANVTNWLSEKEQELSDARQAEIDSFNENIQDIINQNTFSDLEYELSQLSSWYDEQKVAANELGISLSALNEAYDLQKEAAYEEAVLAARNNYIDSLEEEQSILEDALSTAKDNYISGLNDEIDALNETANEAEKTADSFENLLETIEDLKYSSVTDSELNPDRQMAFVSAELATAMAKIQSGDPTEIQAGMEDLPTLTSDFLELSKQTSGSFSAYQNDFAYVMRILNESEQIAGDQKSTAEKSLEELTSQTDELEKTLDEVNGIEDDLGSLEELESAYNAAKTALDESWYQDEIDRLTEINNSVLGLTEAQDHYFNALAESIGAGFDDFLEEYNTLVSETDKNYGDVISGDEVDVSTGTGSLGDITYDDMYPSWVDSAGVQNAYDYANRGSMGVNDEFRAPDGTLTTLADVMRESGIVPDDYSFADGGTVTGPESGYFMPTTFHGTEHITPDSQMQGVKEVLTEVRDLLVSIRDTDGNINKLTIKTNRILDRVTQGGTEIRTKEVA